MTATSPTTTYSLSLHDALPIFQSLDAVTVLVLAPVLMRYWRVRARRGGEPGELAKLALGCSIFGLGCVLLRSEEHTSELQSRPHLVCRLLLEKKNLLVSHSEVS